VSINLFIVSTDKAFERKKRRELRKAKAKAQKAAEKRQQKELPEIKAEETEVDGLEEHEPLEIGWSATYRLTSSEIEMKVEQPTEVIALDSNESDLEPMKSEPNLPESSILEPEFFVVKDEPMEFKDENFDFPAVREDPPDTAAMPIEVIDKLEDLDMEVQLPSQTMFNISVLKLKPKKIVKCSVCKEVKLVAVEGKLAGIFTCNLCVIKNAQPKCPTCKSSLRSSTDVCLKCTNLEPVVLLTRLDPQELVKWRKKRAIIEKAQRQIEALLAQTTKMPRIGEWMTDEPCWCDLCGAKLKSRMAIARHLKLHQLQKKPLPCGECSEVFDNKFALRQHQLKIHERKVQSICHICAKICRNDKILELHLLVHSEGQKCEECEKMVKNMKKHLSTHRDSVQCPTCGRLFAAESVLQKHIDAVHLKLSHGHIFQCERCDEKFTRREDLRR
jgi:hypothetical protein